MSSTSTTDDVSQGIGRIRRLINEPWKGYLLRQDKALFSQLCSSMDVVEDTEELLTAYMAKEFDDSTGARYLAVYGVLQGMFVQQDAIINLCEALHVPETLDNYPRLKEIRDTRNDSVGHPTKRDFKKGQPTSYHHISRISLSHGGFDVLSFFSDGTSQHKEVRLLDLIADQRRFVTGILVKIVAGLEQAEKAHKDKFRMEKLTDIFHPTLSYHIEKVFESIWNEDQGEFGTLNLNMIKDVVRKFRDAIGRRDMDSYGWLQDQYTLIERAFVVLEEFLGRAPGNQAAASDALDARIFAQFLRDEVESLQEYAQQIDEDYEM